jgi:soluble lytic murein transglycosylase-like protein
MAAPAKSGHYAYPSGFCEQASGAGPIGQNLRNAAEQNRLDPALMQAVVCAESGGNPAAASPKGAQGLMQLMPATARRLGVQNTFDVKANLDGGARYLRFLLERYSGDLPRSLAAYNAGENAVDASGGIPPYAETQAYVRKIMESYGQSGAGREWTFTRAAWPIRSDTDAEGRTVFTNE